MRVISKSFDEILEQEPCVLQSSGCSSTAYCTVKYCIHTAETYSQQHCALAALLPEGHDLLCELPGKRIVRFYGLAALCLYAQHQLDRTQPCSEVLHIGAVHSLGPSLYLAPGIQPEGPGTPLGYQVLRAAGLGLAVAWQALLAACRALQGCPDFQKLSPGSLPFSRGRDCLSCCCCCCCLGCSFRF